MVRKFLGLLITLPCTLLLLHAQNNAYGIDDQCYNLFRETESLHGKEGFKEANAALLAEARKKGDTKAETLYYVEQMKDFTQSKRLKPVTEEDDARLNQLMEELKQNAKKNGYIQYYYYAYEMAQTYFYNHDKFYRTMELAQEMQTYARENGDEYGMWMGTRYLVSLYVAQNDYLSAKKFILEALNIFHNSTDPTVKRQSVCRLYCDLADTYPIGHDSVRVNLKKAELAAKQHLDTLRCHYQWAKLAAFDKDIKSYEQHRDYCRQDRLLFQISSTAQQLFSRIDSLVYGYGLKDINFDYYTTRLREVKYTANIAEVYGFKDLAFEIEKSLNAFNEQKISQTNQSRLVEMSARMGNNMLQAQVTAQSIQMRRTSILLMILLTIILLGTLVFLLFYIRNLRRTNEKVRLADAAKTRFVQNMSHEVRTPLNAIVGFSQLLSLPDGSFPEAEKEEFAAHIVNNSKMLTMLLDDILNASAMDKGTYKITYEPGELHRMAQAAISSTEHRLQPGVHMLYVPEQEEPFTFVTDPGRVQQILINLLSNACKHTSAGEIRLTSSLKANPGYVTFAVTDTGMGIPPEQAEKIFERFAKLNDFVQGTGLGLSICRDIADRMGAKVYLDTAYSGKGARFIFQVPVEPTTTLENIKNQ